MASACLTPASVHGVSQLRPASTLLPILQNTPMENAGTGMTGKLCSFETLKKLPLFYSSFGLKGVKTNNKLQLHIQFCKTCFFGLTE